MEQQYMAMQYDAQWRVQATQELLRVSGEQWAAWAWTDETEVLAAKPLCAKVLGEKDARDKALMKLETASTVASTDADTATTCSDDVARTPLKLKELPCLAEDYEVEKTFVTVRPAGGSRKRESSCPARIHTPTTVMLRNLPNRAKQDRIEEHLQQLGFAEAGLYLPLDTRTGVNRGYCFIRFMDEKTALRFTKAVHQTRLPSTTSNCVKRLVAVFAANQGAPLRPRKLRE
jgi:hypothetical protein